MPPTSGGLARSASRGHGECLHPEYRDTAINSSPRPERRIGCEKQGAGSMEHGGALTRVAGVKLPASAQIRASSADQPHWAARRSTNTRANRRDKTATM